MGKEITKEEVREELKEIIHNYPEPLPYDVRKALKDALKVLETDCK